MFTSKKSRSDFEQLQANKEQLVTSCFQFSEVEQNCGVPDTTFLHYIQVIKGHMVGMGLNTYQYGLYIFTISGYGSDSIITYRKT